MLFGGKFQRLELAARTEIGQRRSVALGGISRRIEGKMQDAPRGFDRGERARVNLAEDRCAQGVWDERSTLFDRDT